MLHIHMYVVYLCYILVSSTDFERARSVICVPFSFRLIPILWELLALRSVQMENLN